MGHFTLRPAAERDLDQIAAYIALDNPARAVTFLDEMLTYIQHLADAPLLVPLAPVAGPDIRRAVFGSYLIFFQTKDQGIDVVRVIEGHRDLTIQTF